MGITLRDLAPKILRVLSTSSPAAPGNGQGDSRAQKYLKLPQHNLLEDIC